PRLRFLNGVCPSRSARDKQSRGANDCGQEGYAKDRRHLATVPLSMLSHYRHLFSQRETYLHHSAILTPSATSHYLMARSLRKPHDPPGRASAHSAVAADLLDLRHDDLRSWTHRAQVDVRVVLLDQPYRQ